jgi:hypothetical protein
MDNRKSRRKNVCYIEEKEINIYKNKNIKPGDNISYTENYSNKLGKIIKIYKNTLNIENDYLIYIDGKDTPISYDQLSLTYNFL